MAYETVSALIKAFREDEKDAIEPYFWSDNQLVRWTNEALTEFAEQSESFRDEESDVTLIPYGVGQDRFELDPCIIDVIGAWVDGQPHICLSRSPYPIGNGFRGGYWLAYSGCSSHFHFNPVGILKLHPKPSAAGAVRLQVVRRPLAELCKGDKIPDMLPSDRRHLLAYIAYKAYRVNEGETYSIESSDKHLARFEKACQDAREKDILRRGDCVRPIRSNW
ncbi:hypothetical protein [Pseudomonas syringae]|uniref:hypothetical protein n=1 Tax=Pseudomonas syringae TaxID=317 RepID=UPI001F0EFA7E|nr:hypothetical protein [Pseudomonas syringae]MCH5583115.1 hypothetical protein [Pseudomonas syringae pv. syringae]MCH5592786.1 hypothetical protein [Pseudomonas syringae pv. syringae]MDF5791037.1 hypothetical protein [Pseudomonas syringae pv. syringae]